ncbi:MAG: hypothetical protein NVSMB13_04260 [Mycobacteriales bacterium]
MSAPIEPTASSTRPAPVIPDLSEFLENPGKPPRDRSAGGNRPALVAGAVLGGLLLLAAGFGVGRATAPKGPATLVAAVQQASTGKLPCGTPTANAGFVTRLCNTGANGGGGLAGQAPGGQAGAGQGGAGQGQAGQGGAGRGGVGGLFGPGAVNGTVAAVSGSTLTVSTRGGDVPITLPAGATLSKTATASLADLGKGLPVVVSTTTDAAGKRTATQVFILPASAAPATAPTG